jgi:hypothetical protein
MCPKILGRGMLCATIEDRGSGRRRTQLQKKDKGDIRDVRSRNTTCNWRRNEWLIKNAQAV